MTTTSENNKRIAKNTLLLYGRMLLIMAINIYASRVILDALGEVDYGIYNVVGGFVAMFTIISGAMTTASQRFLSFEIGKNESGNIQTVFSTTVVIHCLLALCIIVLAETIGVWFLNKYMNFPSDRLVAANWVFQFSVLTFVINVISVPYNAAIVAYERMKAFAYVSIIEAILRLLVVYLIIVTSADKLIIYALMLALVSVTIRIIYGIYCRRNFQECRCNWKWNRSIGKEMLSFVSWNLIGSIAGVAKEQGINVLLNIFFGAAINAARGLAYQVMTAMHGFISNFQMAMNPQIVKSYASGKKEEMFKLVFRGSKFSYLLMLTLSVPVIIEAPFILDFWLKEVPAYTPAFLRIVLMTSLIDSMSGTLITSMHASGKVRNYQLLVGGTSILTLPIAYVFFKLGFEPYVAMIVGLCISVICHFERLLLLRKTIHLPVPDFLKNVTFKVWGISALSVIPPVILYQTMEHGWLSFFVVCTVSAVSTVTFSYFLGLSKHEKTVIVTGIKNIIYRIR